MGFSNNVALKQRLNDEYMRGYRAASRMIDGLIALERAALWDATARAELLERFEEHTGGLHCDMWHPEGTCEWQERCDEPGCKREATSGSPTLAGYRRTCYSHIPTVGVQSNG